MRPSNGSGGGGTDAAVAAGATAAGAAGIYGATTASQTGPIIAGVVAIFVALVTWYATDRRQARALAAERERHDATLEAEQLRHEATLRHEERQQDLEELRRVMDGVMEEMVDLSEVHDKAKSAWLALDETAGWASPRTKRRLAQHLQEMDTLAQRLLHQANRLTLRLGDEHDAVVELATFIRAYAGMMGFFKTYQASQSVERARRQLFDALNEDIRRFRAAAFKEVGVRRPTPREHRDDDREGELTP